ncbi:MAG: HAD-IA family hydrolase [Mogibacterium sp.]|nr:HAD-IA family hydrolase [Mogibacterium sp.]
MITTVVFDIGMVLIGFDWERYMRDLFDEETAVRVTRAMFGGSAWKELDRAVLSEEEVLSRFYESEPEYKKEIDEAFERVGECVARRGWVIPFIDSLKERGYRVLYLSNMSEHVLGSNPEAYDFVSRMDGGIWSCRAHLIKPDPGIYRLLLEEYGLAAEECVFIDDTPANIRAAKRLGMKGIVYRDPDQLAADLGQALAKDAGHDRISVLCYGDSNTYAYDPETGGRYPYEKRWTSLLGEMLGGRYEVISEGLNGRTTAYDRPDAAWKNGASSFVACMGTHKPVDYLIIMLGTNDCNADLGLSAADIADGMETLVRLAGENAPALQGCVPQIIVASPAAIGEDYRDSPFADNLTAESVRKSKDIAPLYEEIARRHGCVFVDAEGAAEVSRDCEHLTEKGHRQLAELFRDAITGAG